MLQQASTIEAELKSKMAEYNALKTVPSKRERMQGSVFWPYFTIYLALSSAASTKVCKVWGLSPRVEEYKMFLLLGSGI